MKIFFKDEDGREYELVRLNTVDNTQYALSPIIKPESKWEVSISDGKDDTRNYTYINIGLYDVSEDQAQLIKGWVSAGMAYMTGDGEHSAFVIATGKARTAIEEANNA